MSTPTPRTDAAAFTPALPSVGEGSVVQADFARQLERKATAWAKSANDADDRLKAGLERETTLRAEVERLQAICTDHAAAMSSASLAMVRMGRSGPVRPGALITELQGQNARLCEALKLALFHLPLVKQQEAVEAALCGKT